jgi:hypothetical protein
VSRSPRTKQQVQPRVPIVSETLTQAGVSIRGIREFVQRGRERLDIGEAPERRFVLEPLGIRKLGLLKEIRDECHRLVDHRAQAEAVPIPFHHRELRLVQPS